MFGMFGRMWRGRVPTAAAALGAAMSPAAHAMGVSKHDAVQSYKEEAARAKQYSDAMKWVADGILPGGSVADTTFTKSGPEGLTRI